MPVFVTIKIPRRLLSQLLIYPPSIKMLTVLLKIMSPVRPCSLAHQEGWSYQHVHRVRSGCCAFSHPLCRFTVRLYQPSEALPCIPVVLLMTGDREQSWYCWWQVGHAEHRHHLPACVIMRSPCKLRSGPCCRRTASGSTQQAQSRAGLQTAGSNRQDLLLLLTHWLTLPLLAKCNMVAVVAWLCLELPAPRVTQPQPHALLLGPKVLFGWLNQWCLHDGLGMVIIVHTLP